jgi:hypothetical protein
MAKGIFRLEHMSSEACLAKLEGCFKTELHPLRMINEKRYQAYFFIKSRKVNVFARGDQAVFRNCFYAMEMQDSGKVTQKNQLSNQ